MHGRADNNNVGHRYWLVAVGNHHNGHLAFTADSLAWPFGFAGWNFGPGPETTDLWPGDILHTAKSSFFVTHWGKLYSAPWDHLLYFAPLEGNASIVAPVPAPSWDDLHQIEFTFAPPDPIGGGGSGGRYLLYHVSVCGVQYSDEQPESNSRRLHYGYKQAISVYSFALPNVENMGPGIKMDDEIAQLYCVVLVHPAWNFSVAHRSGEVCTDARLSHKPATDNKTLT